MSVTSLGDLSQSYAMRLRNVSLRQEIDRLTQELATGQVADVSDVLAGNYSYLTDIERRLDVLNGYDVSTSEAAIFGSSIQSALGVVGEFGSTLASSLLTAGTSATSANSSDKVLEARTTLDGLMSTMNTSASGRYIFSGVATDRPPLPDSEVLLTELRSALIAAGAVTTDEVLAASKAWFDDPAGFEATVYEGGTQGLAPMKLSETEQVTLDVRPTDPNLRELLRLTAVAALADNGPVSFDPETKASLFQKIGTELMVAQDNLIAVRADVGFAEAQIERIGARNAAEATSLEFAKLDLLNVDPYEAATRLEEAQFQLQSLYSVTVKMSQLSLVNFI